MKTSTLLPSLICLAILASCSSAPETQEPTNESASSAPETRDLPPWVVVPEGEEGVTYADDGWSPGDELPVSRISSWSAPEKITRHVFTPEESLEYHLEQLTQASLSRVDDPFTADEVSLGEERPFVEAWELIGQCMTDKGFPAVSGPIGGFFFPSGIPTGQNAAYDVAWVECYSATPPDPSGNHFEAYSDEDRLSIYYDYWTQALIPCLGTIGVPNSFEAPTKEFFIDHYLNQEATGDSDSLASWWPPNWTEGRVKAEAACPPYPTDTQFLK